MTTNKINTKVVGTSFVAKEVLEEIEDRDFVVILPEFDNPHDPCACQVIHVHTNQRFGYLKRENDYGPFSKSVWEDLVNKRATYVGRVVIIINENHENKGYNLELTRVSK